MQQIKTKELIEKNSFNVSDSVILDIWFSLNQKAIDSIIESGGEPFTFYDHFGCLKIKRRKAKIRLVNGKPKLYIAWGKTKKLRKEGILAPDKYAYNMSPYYFDIVWGNRTFKNQSKYSFKGSRTNGVNSTSGFKNKLWKFLTSSDTNYLKFPLCS